MIASVHMERFEVALGEDQYEDLMFVTDALSRFARQSKYLHLR